jgi:hypothetical protein
VDSGSQQTVETANLSSTGGGHEEHWQIRIQGEQLARKFAAILLRERDVRDQKIESTCVHLVGIDGRQISSGRYDFITLLPEDAAHEFKVGKFVVDDEDFVRSYVLLHL